MSAAEIRTAGARRRPAVARRRRRAGLPRWALVAVAVAVPLLLLAWWWAASAASTNTFFPPLATILQRFQALWLFDHFASDVLPSVGNLALSFLLASVIGVALGTALGLVRPLAWLLDPVIHFWRAIPPVALVPIFVALFGFGTETRIASITLAALFPTLISAVDGVRSVDPTLLDVTRGYRLRRWERVLLVTLPAASPRILSGMQVSLQVAFIVMIASEMLGSSVGIGAMTLLAQQSFAIADMWAGILLLGVIGFAANALFDLFRRWVLAWYIHSQRLGRLS